MLVGVYGYIIENKNIKLFAIFKYIFFAFSCFLFLLHNFPCIIHLLFASISVKRKFAYNQLYFMHTHEFVLYCSCCWLLVFFYILFYALINIFFCATLLKWQNKKLLLSKCQQKPQWMAKTLQRNYFPLLKECFLKKKYLCGVCKK